MCLAFSPPPITTDSSELLLRREVFQQTARANCLVSSPTERSYLDLANIMRVFDRQIAGELNAWCTTYRELTMTQVRSRIDAGWTLAALYAAYVVVSLPMQQEVWATLASVTPVWAN